MYTVILAGNYQEAMAYAAANRYRIAHTRGVARAESIRGLVVSHVVELPSYARRPDRHAIEAVLRTAARRNDFTREVVEHWERPVATPEGEVPGQLLLPEGTDVEFVHGGSTSEGGWWTVSTQDPGGAADDDVAAIREAEALLGQPLEDEIVSAEQVDAEIAAAETEAQDRPKSPEPKPDRSKKRPSKPKPKAVEDPARPYEDPAGPADVAATPPVADFWSGVQ